MASFLVKKLVPLFLNRHGTNDATDNPATGTPAFALQPCLT